MRPRGDDRHARFLRYSESHSQQRSEEHTSELQSRLHLVCRPLLEKKKEQGHIVVGLWDTVAKLPDSYAALAIFARSLADLPMEVDLPFDEPSTLDVIWAACDPERP